MDSTQLLFNFQRIDELNQSIADCIQPEEIARRITDGLVDKFDCAFARIWLVESDRTFLKLIASSGMYERLDGDFAKVPMGAYKVGKIAQHCIPFLSNQLAQEAWVKDREWAISNQICGFAGLPLAIQSQAIGVLIVFSQKQLGEEFLEALRILCTSVAVALKNARLHTRAIAAQKNERTKQLAMDISLWEQLSAILDNVRLIVVGTERPLNQSLDFLLLRATEKFKAYHCNYCRLSYEAQQISLEAILDPQRQTQDRIEEWLEKVLGEIAFPVACLGGVLQTQTVVNEKVVRVKLNLPYPSYCVSDRLCIDCSQPILQTALTHLAYLAGLTICQTDNFEIPLLTDKIDRIATAKTIIWLTSNNNSIPSQVKAKIDLSISPQQLKEAVATVTQGKTWGLKANFKPNFQLLSAREREVITLLAEGLRDLEIAKKLFISDRTVKFHINNAVSKLQSRTRIQAIYQAHLSGLV